MYYKSVDIRLFLGSVIVFLLYIILLYIQYTPPHFFLISILAIYLLAPPKYILNPKNILFGYYFLWFTIPVIYAPRYESYSFKEKEQVLAYCMLIMTYLIAFNTLHFTIKDFEVERKYRVISFDFINKIKLSYLHSFFLSLSLLACMLMMVTSSFGISGWLQDPGAAFQQRDGAGLATILLIFSSNIAIVTGGVYLSKSKFSKKILLFFIYTAFIGIYLMFLLHRQRLINYFILLYLIPFFYVRAKFRTILFIFLGISISIIFASFLRGTGSTAEGDMEIILRIFLNYFDTYNALVISIENVQPEILGTSLMAFKKLFIGVGYDPNMPYSISQWLTPIYFPGYAERTTIQFPIETEMYLNGYYFGMVPILILYFWLIGKIYTYAFQTGNIGFIYVSFYITLDMIGHLRGMFIDFTDLYNYPLMIISYFILNNINESFKPKYLQKSFTNI